MDYKQFYSHLNNSKGVISEAKYVRQMRNHIVDKIGNEIGVGRMGTDENFAVTGGKTSQEIADAISDLLNVDVKVVQPGEKVEQNSGRMDTISNSYEGVHFEYEDKIYNLKLSAGSKAGAGGEKKPRDAAYYEMGICVEYNKRQGMDREEAMKAADVEESKYSTYEEHLTKVCSVVAENLPNMGSFLRQTGGESFSPSPVWPSTDGTPKTDIYGGNPHRISVKKKGGSQLISGGAGDAKGIFSGGFAFYNRYSNKAKKDSADIIKSIEDNFKRFNTDNTVTTVRKEAMGNYVEWRIPQIEKTARNLKLNLNANDAERHAKAEAKAAGIGTDRGNWKKWFIEEIEPISDRKIMDWFDGYWKSKATKELQEEARDIVNALISHSRLDKEFKKIFEEKEFKKWCVYEAASGNYKFSGDDDISSPDDPIANEILVFGLNGDIDVKTIDDKWSSKYANKVTPQVNFKTSGKGKYTAFRLISEDISYDKLSVFERDVNKIISEELKQINNDVSVLFENYDKKMNNIINEISLRNMMQKMKKLGKKLIKNITDKIKSFYDNVIKRVLSNLKKYAKEGLDRFLEILGIEVDGTASVDIQF